MLPQHCSQSGSVRDQLRFGHTIAANSNVASWCWFTARLLSKPAKQGVASIEPNDYPVVQVQSAAVSQCFDCAVFEDCELPTDRLLCQCNITASQLCLASGLFVLNSSCFGLFNWRWLILFLVSGSLLIVSALRMK